MQDELQQYADAIAAVESRGQGDYAAVGPRTRSGDRAYGRYQVMGSNIPSWTKAATGETMTPQEFLKSKEAQDAVFRHRFGSYLDVYGNPQDAASVWFTGKPLATGGNRSDGYITGNEYVRRFNNALGTPSNLMAFADTDRGNRPTVNVRPQSLDDAKQQLLDEALHYNRQQQSEPELQSLKDDLLNEGNQRNPQPGQELVLPAAAQETSSTAPPAQPSIQPGLAPGITTGMTAMSAGSGQEKFNRWMDFVYKHPTDPRSVDFVLSMLSIARPSKTVATLGLSTLLSKLPASVKYGIGMGLGHAAVQTGLPELQGPAHSIWRLLSEEGH